MCIVISILIKMQIFKYLKKVKVKQIYLNRINLGYYFNQKLKISKISKIYRMRWRNLRGKSIVYR